MEKDVKVKTTSKGIIALIICLGVLYVIGIGVLFFAVFTSIDNGIYTKFEYNNNGDVELKENIKIVSVDPIVTNDGTYYLDGYFLNESETKYSYVSIEYTIYDVDGAVIDKLNASIDDFSEHKVWHFMLKYDGPDYHIIDKYELSKVTLY